MMWEGKAHYNGPCLSCGAEVRYTVNGRFRRAPSGPQTVRCTACGCGASLPLKDLHPAHMLKPN